MAIFRKKKKEVYSFLVVETETVEDQTIVSFKDLGISQWSAYVNFRILQERFPFALMFRRVQNSGRQIVKTLQMFYFVK